jgi:cell division protease FtsH
MNFKNIAMWAIIVFLTIGLYNMFKNPQANVRNGNQVIFSDFLTSVENGEVLKAGVKYVSGDLTFNVGKGCLF